MADLRVVGVDPGPVPGLLLLDYSQLNLNDPPRWEPMRAEALQCTAGLLEAVLRTLIGSTWPDVRVLVATEQFVTGNRTHRSSTPEAGRRTAEMVEEIRAVCQAWETKLYVRRAADVKPWATANHNARLAAARLLEPTEGMRHARSAAWHALFCAVHDGGVPDPLSRKAG